MNTATSLGPIERLMLIVSENPCHWKQSSIDAVATGIEVLASAHGVSLLDLSEYFHTTIRSIQRWRKRYKDFPVPIDPYAKPLCFRLIDIIDWKRAHSDLF